MFPDEFHLVTLNEFLDACAELNEGVKLRNVLSLLIDRLAMYSVADGSPGIPSDIQLFEIFSKHAERVIGSRNEMPPEDIIAIQVFRFSALDLKILDGFDQFGSEMLSGANGLCQHSLRRNA